MAFDLNHYLDNDGPVARRLERYEPRPQQAAMAEAIDRTMETRGQLMVEAGTGVGKSFAYLLPAIKRIVEHSERVVVATHTINLQEQLIEKDVPLLNALIPEEFSAVLVKGRSNYVSIRRLKLASERQDRLFISDDARHALHMIEDWAYRTTDGSLATLPQLPRSEVWDHVQSDSHNCMGRKCPTFDKCFYQAARRRMENADLLITNHALFFADLALRGRGAGFLPKYDHVILDEAHGVEDVAAEHFGLTLSQGQVVHLLNLLYQPRSNKGFLTTLKLKDASTQLVDRAIQQSLTCRDESDILFQRMDRWLSNDGPANGRVSESGFVDNTLTDQMKELAGMLRILRTKSAREPDAYELNSYAQRAADVAEAAEVLIGQTIDGCVYWVESTESRASRRRRVALKCMAVDVAPILRERLFGQKNSVVMTSATLTSGPDDFSHISGRLGCESAGTLQLGSPFDYETQMRVIVDRSLPAPNDRNYVDQLIPRIQSLVDLTDGGAFVLFTSFEMLNLVAERLRPALIERGHPVMVQGADGLPGVLLRRFREQERAVLLGTTSFWQGVDVRGRALRNVIITRLPFDVPDRPLVQARLERIQEQGGNPFFNEQVPRAILRLKQGVGRLIRSTTDTGVVAILDPRIVNKPYGKLFLRALPAGAKAEQLVMNSTPG